MAQGAANRNLRHTLCVFPSLMSHQDAPADQSVLIKVAEGVGRAVGTAERRINEYRGRTSREMAFDLGEFAARGTIDHMSAAALDALKLRVLDSLGCAIGALPGTPIVRIREQFDDF